MDMAKRVKSEQIISSQEAAEVVKGTAKRVIVVKSPDKKVFEEAIFIVREDYMKTAGVTRSQLLSEARRAAGSYTGSMQRSEKIPTALVAALSTLIGSGAAAAIMYFIM